MNIQLKHIILIIVLLIIQIFWFNHILLFGKFQALVYIFPLLLLPVYQNKTTNLLLAFTIGLIMDFFLNTGGVFAATTVFIVYFRKIYFTITKNPSQNIETFKVINLFFGKKILFYIIFIFISYLLIFGLESLQLSFLVSKIPVMLINTLISLLFFIFIEYFFIKNQHDK